MALIESINVLFMPLAILALIIVDYSHIHVTDRFQRKIFLLIIYLTAAAVICDMVYDTFAGTQWRFSRFIVYSSCFGYYLFQIAAYHALNLFVDYNINSDESRTKML